MQKDPPLLTSCLLALAAEMTLTTSPLLSRGEMDYHDIFG
jgi:hypothetical protein